MARCWT